MVHGQKFLFSITLYFETCSATCFVFLYFKVMVWRQVYQSISCHILLLIILFFTLINVLLPYSMLYSKCIIGNFYIVMFENLWYWNITKGKERQFVWIVLINSDFYYEKLGFWLQNEVREIHNRDLQSVWEMPTECLLVLPCPVIIVDRRL